MRRMDRYNDTSDVPKLTRSDKNQELYDSIGSNTRYTSFSDVTNSNAIDISTKKNSNTREGYHQMKEYQDVVPVPRVKKELEEFKSLYQDRENKVYDINNVLEEARKNRTEKDELEEKRKLKNSSYNILSNLNKEELEKYRKEKKEKVIHPNDDELRELIDTITSKTLAGDIQAASSLLSDLMATSIMDKVDKPEDIPEEEKEEKDDEDEEDSLDNDKLNVEDIKRLADKKEELAHAEDDDEDEKEESSLPDADASFYTRSMDLSEADFDLESEFKEKHLPVGIKVLIGLIILVIIAAVAFFIWKNQ